MDIYIQVWPNNSATLLTTNGYVLSTFSNEAAAQQVKEEWNKANKNPARSAMSQVTKTPPSSPPLYLI